MKNFKTTLITTVDHAKGRTVNDIYLTAETKVAAKKLASQHIFETDGANCIFYKAPRLEEITAEEYIANTEKQTDITAEPEINQYCALMVMFGYQSEYDEDEIRDIQEFLTNPDEERDLFESFLLIKNSLSEKIKECDKSLSQNEIKQMAVELYKDFKNAEFCEPQIPEAQIAESIEDEIVGSKIAEYIDLGILHSKISDCEISKIVESQNSGFEEPSIVELSDGEIVDSQPQIPVKAQEADKSISLSKIQENELLTQSTELSTEPVVMAVEKVGETEASTIDIEHKELVDDYTDKDDFINSCIKNIADHSIFSAFPPVNGRIMSGENISLAMLNECVDRLQPTESLIVRRLSNSMYHASNGYSSTQIRHVESGGLAELEWHKNAPCKDTKSSAFIIGSAVHAAILEPERFAEEYICVPELDLRTKDGRQILVEFEAQALANNQIALKKEDFEQVELMRGSALAYPMVEELLENGEPELSIFYRTKNGTLFKIRPDWLGLHSGVPFILDVKTTDDVHDFGKSVDKFGYHLQSAFYRIIANQVFNLDLDLTFCVINKKLDCGRYPVRLIKLSEEYNAKGVIQANNAIEELENAKEIEPFVTISKPFWAKKSDIEHRESIISDAQNTESQFLTSEILDSQIAEFDSTENTMPFSIDVDNREIEKSFVSTSTNAGIELQTEKKKSFQQEVWETLSSINVNDKVEKKNGLSYLSWAWAWGVLKEHYPESYSVVNNEHIRNDGSVTVSVTLTIKQGEKEFSSTMRLPVMDYRNQAIVNPNSMDTNKAEVRCLAKAIAMFGGLGFYLYAGEDLPEDEKVAIQHELAQRKDRHNQLICDLKKAASGGVDAMKLHWSSLTPEEMAIIGEKSKADIYRNIAMKNSPTNMDAESLPVNIPKVEQDCIIPDEAKNKVISPKKDIAISVVRLANASGNAWRFPNGEIIHGFLAAEKKAKKIGMILEEGSQYRFSPSH